MRIYLFLKKVVLLILVFLSIGANSSDMGEFDIKQRLEHSEELYGHKDYRSSINILEQLSLDYPHNAEVKFRLGSIKIHLARGHDRDNNSTAELAKEGMLNLEKAVRLDPDNIHYLAAYSAVAGDMHKDELAVKYFRELFAKAGVRKSIVYRYLVINYYLSLERSGFRDMGLIEYKKSLIETNYDSRIAIGYIGALGYTKDIPSLQKFYVEFVDKKGRFADVEIAVCSEIAAAESYLLAKNCFKKVVGNTNYSQHYRNNAREHIKRVESLKLTGSGLNSEPK